MKNVMCSQKLAGSQLNLMHETSKPNKIKIKQKTKTIKPLSMKNPKK